MFRGNFEHLIDEKGRISVPAKFRDVITAANDDRVVVTNFKYGAVPCLDAYLYGTWLRLEEHLRQQPQFEPATTAFLHYYVASARECQVDKQGRLLLPPILREYAQLKSAVTLAGMGEKFQIWDGEAWKENFRRAEETVITTPETLSRFIF